MNLYLILHERSDVTGLPSGCGAHIQDPFSRTRPEHVAHDYRGEVLHRHEITRVKRQKFNQTIILILLDRNSTHKHLQECQAG